MTIKTDALIMRTINNMIGETLFADAAAFTGSKTLNYINSLWERIKLN